MSLLRLITFKQQARSLWTPAVLTTALWLDASDSSTVTLNGSNISQWRDKSGNARHVSQGSSSFQPTKSTINAIDAIRFDGTNDVLSGSLTSDISGNFYFIMVGQALSLASPQGYVVSEVTTPYANYWAFLGVYPSNQVHVALYNGTQNPQLNGSTAAVNEIFFQIGERNSGTLTLYKNGSAIGSVADNTTSVPNYSLIRIGGQVNPARYANANIGEVLIIPGTLSVSTRQIIEGYLAHKWGLTANLPAGHPYKTTPPYV